jgi:selenide,water dikinase
MDDAGVVKINDDLALVQTIDVFPPVVDDPYWYGRITAANSLSDIYAMGAVPLAAVNFVGYPLDKLGGEPLARMLEGAFDALEEADCAMAGGHSIADNEVKFGLSVTGTVHPDKVVRNVGALPGDVLVLSKPLGTGCLTTALKQGATDEAHVDAAHRIMARLNRNASEAMLRAGAHAATDVTGFGLVGHTYEIAEGSNVSIVLRAADVPLLPEAKPYLKARFTCGGSKRNVAYAQGRIEIPDDLPEDQAIALTDVQTSGGLLIAVAPDRAEALIEDLRAGGDTLAAAIGLVASTGPTLVVH